MIDTPQIVQADEQMTAVIRITVPRTEIAQAMGPAIAEILAALRAQGRTPAGPCFSFHWKRPTDVFDFEVGFPVDAPIAASGRVKPGRLPAGKVVRTFHRGGYEGLGAAWESFCAWTEAQGIDVQESLWERYLVGPESTPDPASWCTELNRPLAG